MSAKKDEPLSDEERNLFNAILARLVQLQRSWATLDALSANAQSEVSAAVATQLARGAEAKFHKLARAVVKGAKSEWSRQSRPGNSAVRAEVAEAFALALALLRERDSADPGDLPRPVDTYLIELIATGYLGADIQSAPREAWEPHAAAVVRATLAAAFAGFPQGTSLVADGPTSAGVGCAARLFGVSPSTVWGDRRSRPITREALEAAIALRYGSLRLSEPAAVDLTQIRIASPLLAGLPGHERRKP